MLYLNYLIENDPLSLESYRSISLLNVDLKKACLMFNKEDQTWYVKHRFTGFNLRQIQDIIDYAEFVAIIFVAFTKAFDSMGIYVKRSKTFGFNESFISWMEKLYKEIHTV